MLLPVIEGVVVIAMVAKVRHIRATMRRADQLLWFDRLWPALIDVLGPGRATRVVETEIGLLGLAVMGWRMQPSTSTNIFTSHRRRRVIGTMGALICASALELVAVHVLVGRRSNLTVWILTGLTACAMLWLLGDLQGIRTHPHVITSDELRMRVGLRWSANIPLQEVEVAERLAPGEVPGDALVLVPLGDADMLLRLRSPAIVTGLFGL